MPNDIKANQGEIDFLDSNGDRWVTFNNGTLKITDYQDGVGVFSHDDLTCQLSQEIALRNWDEIERLRNFLNKLDFPKGESCNGQI
ncbi:MAG TPA: hypothetical protein VE710_18195 [Candidatus Bathyarchaeia archaeon]|nr:hypothetical protein [Candidatus Bathyarchaeia archaeon]